MILVLPEFAGTLWASGQLAGTLPADLSGRPVTVDASTSLAVTQGFIDELIGQLVDRGAPHIVLISGSERVIEHALRAVHLRQASVVLEVRTA